MEKLTHIIDKILVKVLIVLMTVMVLDVTWQVFTRFVMRDSSSYTEELARFLLIWIGLLGASYAIRTKAHLGIDIFSKSLKGVKKQIVAIGVHTLIFLFALIIMVVGGLRLVQITFFLNQISAALGIRMAYIYLVLPISGCLIMYYSVHFIVEIRRSTKLDKINK